MRELNFSRKETKCYSVLSILSCCFILYRDLYLGLYLWWSSTESFLTLRKHSSSKNFRNFHQHFLKLPPRGRGFSSMFLSLKHHLRLPKSMVAMCWSLALPLPSSNTISSPDILQTDHSQQRWTFWNQNQPSDRRLLCDLKAYSTD